MNGKIWWKEYTSTVTSLRNIFLPEFVGWTRSKCSGSAYIIISVVLNGDSSFGSVVSDCCGVAKRKKSNKIKQEAFWEPNTSPPSTHVTTPTHPPTPTLTHPPPHSHTPPPTHPPTPPPKLTELWQFQNLAYFFTWWPSFVTYFFATVTCRNQWLNTHVYQVWWWYIKAFVTYAWQNRQTNRQTDRRTDRQTNDKRTCSPKKFGK